MDTQNLMDKDKLLAESQGLGKSLLGFDKMITPIIVKVLYFLLLLGVLLGTVFALVNGQILQAVAILIFGTLWVRLISESLILMFRIHDMVGAATKHLNEIKENTAKRL